MDRVHFVLRLPLACTGQKESEVDWLKETTVWVEGVTKDLVVVEEVGRVAWEVLKLMLLNGVAKVEGRELGHKELLVLRKYVVLVTVVNLLVDATVLLVKEVDLGHDED